MILRTRDRLLIYCIFSQGFTEVNSQSVTGGGIAPVHKTLPATRHTIIYGAERRISFPGSYIQLLSGLWVKEKLINFCHEVEDREARPGSAWAEHHVPIRAAADTSAELSPPEPH